MNDQTSPSRPGTIEHQIASLPPLPDTVMRVMEVTNNPESSANDLMKAILPDQSMCVAILKLANSAFYGRPSKVGSVEQAIMVLGFNEVQNIVLAKAALNNFRPVMQKYRAELKQFWEHAFICGLAAKNIAEQLNQEPGPFFMAGLLHDLGKLAILLTFGDRYQPEKYLLHLSTDASIQQERESFTVSHDLVGGHLLKKWQFPKSLITALQYHHSPQKAPGMQAVALIIQLADFLAHMSMQPEKPAEGMLAAELQLKQPGFIGTWKNMKLPWQETTLETWFAFLEVDRKHGSAVLDILAA